MVFYGTEATDLLKTKDGAPGPSPIRTHFGKEVTNRIASEMEYVTRTGRESHVTRAFSLNVDRKTETLQNRQKVEAVSRPIWEKISS